MDNKEKLKSLLKRVQDGEDIDGIKQKFKDLLEDIPPEEIPAIEQELVEEGITPEEITQMCDAHLEIFRESVEDKLELGDLSEGHPLKVLYEENEQITKDAELLNIRVSSIKEADDTGEKMKRIGELADLVSDFLKMDKTHYMRQEMIIFPHIEKRGINAVPRVLWRKHNENIGNAKRMLNLLSEKPENPQKLIEKLEEMGEELSESLMDMVFRENNILYPTLKYLLSEEEWVAVKEQGPEVGYYKVEPESWDSEEEPKYPYQVEQEITEGDLSELPEQLKSIIGDKKPEPDDYQIKDDEDMEMEFGFLTHDEINLILKTLPVDLTFIDENDRVRYFTETERIFPRTKSIIGRPVKYCHPPKSVEKVEKILEEFKSGDREKAEFWIQMKGNFVLIRYYPIRDEEGEYMGALEIVQDVTEIRELEGEKRLAD